MEPRGGSIVTLSYLGSERVFPGYNVMGVAKAALESTVRYLAADIGPKNIRVNAVSAGPIKTLAAAGIKGFSNILHIYPDRAPLRRNVETAEVAEAAAFLLSDAGKGITGEVLLVDADSTRRACSYPAFARVSGAPRTSHVRRAASAIRSSARPCPDTCGRRPSRAATRSCRHRAETLPIQPEIDKGIDIPGLASNTVFPIACCSSCRLFSASSRPQPASTTMNSSPA